MTRKFPQPRNYQQDFLTTREDNFSLKYLRFASVTGYNNREDIDYEKELEKYEKEILAESIDTKEELKEIEPDLDELDHVDDLIDEIQPHKLLFPLRINKHTKSKDRSESDDEDVDIFSWRNKAI